MDKSYSIGDNYSFDEVIDRRQSRSIKFDYKDKYQMPEDILPLWVADMDFKSPPCINQAMAERCVHGIYGYSDVTDDYLSAVQNWYARRYDYSVNKGHIVTVPGVVFALYTAVMAFSKPGDGVLIQRPVYYPFSSAVSDLDRILVNNPLVCKEGRYEIDFADFEQKIMDHKVKIFILCNPHNPVGRVWTREELIRLGEICLRHQVIVISDEIHSDFIYPGHEHTIFASLSPEIDQITITCTAPSKTFNLAGLQISNIIINNDKLRADFTKAMGRSGYSQPNLMGLIACQAAYEEGDKWLEDLLLYLQGNIAYLTDFLAKELPQVKVVKPEGTYLLWVDFAPLGMSEDDLRHRLTQVGAVWLHHGTMFGSEGDGYQRINIACPRAILAEGANRIKQAILS